MERANRCHFSTQLHLEDQFHKEFLGLAFGNALQLENQTLPEGTGSTFAPWGDPPIYNALGGLGDTPFCRFFWGILFVRDQSANQ